MMTKVQDALTQGRNRLGISQRELAARLSDVLAARTLPPFGISNTTISLNESGTFVPESLTWEYIRDHAPERGHDELVELAQAVLDARIADEQARSTPTK
jgi:transcriptional regulator with XRE-family HTH domain